MSMLTDDRELADLERRLRDACRATIPQLMAREATGSSGVAPTFESGTFDLVRGDPPPTRHRWLAAAAAAVLIVGAVALIARSMDTDRAAAPGSATEPSDGQLVPTSTGVPMLDLGTPDPLPVAPGVTDFYVGAEDLGEPALSLDAFERVTRCVALSADGTTCERIEGIAHVPLATYTGVRGTGTAYIGTTFAEVEADRYADMMWDPGDSSYAERIPVTMRGHAGLQRIDDRQSGVAWVERPGVLVWVVVTPDIADDLLTIAEGVRLVDGPATIPHRVVVPDLGTAWDATPELDPIGFIAGLQEGNGFVVALHDGVECFGFPTVISCGRTPADRVWSRPTADGGMLVLGAASSDVASVNVVLPDDSKAGTATIGFGPYAARFFSFRLSDERYPVADPVVIEWLSADGTVLDRGPVGALPATAAPTTTTLPAAMTPTTVGEFVGQATFDPVDGLDPTTTSVLPPDETFSTSGAMVGTTAPPPGQTTTTSTLPASPG